MNKKIIFLLASCIVLIGLTNLASAATNPCGNDNSYSGTFKQGDIINLKQVCDTCSHVNVSRINYPDSTFNNLESAMTKAGINYNLSFSDTYKIGCYSYDVYGDKDGVENTTETIYFQITPSGSRDNLGFYIVIIIIIYGISLIGFFGQNEILTLFGCIPMFILGVYLVVEGLAGFRETVTMAIGFISIGIGAYFSFEAGRSLYEV